MPLLKNPRLRILALVLPALVAAGVYISIDGVKKPFRCPFDSAKWAAVGFPEPSAMEAEFNRSLENEGAFASSDRWAVELNCSSQEPAIGRLFKRYLTSTPQRWPLLALTAWGLSTSEQRQSTVDSSKRFEKIFALPDVESYFSKESIVEATEKLKAGEFEYADALLSVTERKLNKTDQPKLRAMVRSLEQ